MTSNTLIQLKNNVQNYHWGTRSSIAILLNKAELITETPIAEYWIGAHPLLPSRIAETNETLFNYLANKNPSSAPLPFLVKLLSAETPLSIQVHPNKQQAQKGFADENNKNLSQNSPERNYKDDNHKPETIFALTHFSALVGFRSRSTIVSDAIALDNEVLSREIIKLSNSDDESFTKQLTLWALSLNTETLKRVINDLITKQKTHHIPTLDTVVELFNHYQYDAGVLMGLLLNKMMLKPGESIFLKAGLPHAYLEGTGIEVMASSDNVLRAGLTPKHVDIPELMNIVDFNSYRPEIQACNFNPEIHSLNVPVDDYQIDYIVCDNSKETITLSSSTEILHIVSGTLVCNGQILRQGESFATSSEQALLCIEGSGHLLRVYSKEKEEA